MNREQVAWTALGTAGVAVLFGRRTYASDDGLGSPIEVAGIPRVTPHGYFRAHRAGPPEHWHQGIDLIAPPSSRVFAVGDGTIIKAEPGLGKIVRKLRLGAPGSWGGLQSIDLVVYADLGVPIVEPGKRVRKGDVIAFVAHEGFVHFAVKQKRARGETFIDPKLAGFVYRTSPLEVA